MQQAARPFDDNPGHAGFYDYKPGVHQVTGDQLELVPEPQNHPQPLPEEVPARSLPRSNSFTLFSVAESEAVERDLKQALAVFVAQGENFDDVMKVCDAFVNLDIAMADSLDACEKPDLANAVRDMQMCVANLAQVYQRITELKCEKMFGKEMVEFLQQCEGVKPMRQLQRLLLEAKELVKAKLVMTL